MSAVTPQYLAKGVAHILQDKVIPPYVTVLRVHGPFLFGTTDKLEQSTKDLDELADVVVLRLRNMTALDAMGVHALEHLSDRLRMAGKAMILCGAMAQPARLLARSQFATRLGRDNICPNIEAALERASDLVRDRTLVLASPELRDAASGLVSQRRPSRERAGTTQRRDGRRAEPPIAAATCSRSGSRRHEPRGAAGFGDRRRLREKRWGAHRRIRRMFDSTLSS